MDSAEKYRWWILRGSLVSQALAWGCQAQSTEVQVKFFLWENSLFLPFFSLFKKLQKQTSKHFSLQNPLLMNTQHREILLHVCVPDCALHFDWKAMMSYHLSNFQRSLLGFYNVLSINFQAIIWYVLLKSNNSFWLSIFYMLSILLLNI